jgi:hypothetical protein
MLVSNSRLVNTYIPLTLYPRSGNRGISDIPTRRPDFIIIFINWLFINLIILNVNIVYILVGKVKKYFIVGTTSTTTTPSDAIIKKLKPTPGAEDNEVIQNDGPLFHG